MCLLTLKKDTKKDSSKFVPASKDNPLKKLRSKSSREFCSLSPVISSEIKGYSKKELVLIRMEDCVINRGKKFGFYE